MQESPEQGENLVTQILDRVKNTARVEVVYGEAREINGRTIIPVAVVGYAFGGGSGPAVNPFEDGTIETVGSGGGGGGAVRVQPVGVLEVTEDETRFMPILDWTRIITTFLTLFGVWMILRTLFRRRR